MDRDDFIIAVFLVVCEQYQAIKKLYRLRRGGFVPALMDEEVITMEICGEYFKLECDKDIFAYFHQHYLHFFPKLSDRSLFVRQAANLWQVKAAIQKRLVMVSGQANDPVQIIEPFPYQRVFSPEPYETVVSRPKPILGTVLPKTCTTTVSSWGCGSRAWA